MDPALRLQPGQQDLTPAQEAETRRFVEACTQRQLSTEPVDEPEAEAWLRQAYEVAGLAAPQHIYWLDGPLQLVALLAPPGARGHIGASVEAGVEERVRASVIHSVYHSVYHSKDRVKDSGDNVYYSVIRSIYHSVGTSLWRNLRLSLRATVPYSITYSVGNSVTHCLWNRFRASLWVGDWANAPDSVRDSAVDVYRSVWDRDIVSDSVRAYGNAHELTFCRFFAVYLAPNELQALAQFNEMVSGYWLGHEVALIVRRPQALAIDAESRLHSATGRAIEYRDGWGCYAWHGTPVPEKVILAPGSLTRDDFLNEKDVEVRRIMQERMGSRFVSELGGVVLDSGPRGILYEVQLPSDPRDRERVACYVQVQDASTPRQYFLRVPPTIQTAAEAVAWSFGLSAEEYHPAQET
jgi:hypothetical protein